MNNIHYKNSNYLQILGKFCTFACILLRNGAK